MSSAFPVFFAVKPMVIESSGATEYSVPDVMLISQRWSGSASTKRLTESTTFGSPSEVQWNSNSKGVWAGTSAPNVTWTVAIVYANGPRERCSRDIKLKLTDGECDSPGTGFAWAERRNSSTPFPGFSNFKRMFWGSVTFIETLWPTESGSGSSRVAWER